MEKIAPAFIKAKKAFLPAMKDKTNPHFRSKYADLGACLDAVEDALLENGIALYQETFEDLTGVTVETILLHESGQIIRGGKLHVPAAKQDPQGYGSALTYARRYALMTACGIAPEDDDGNAACAPKQKPTAAILQNTSPELAKSVAKDTFDKMDEHTKNDLRTIAIDVISYLAKDDPVSAFDYIERMELDADSKTALWSLFDSKQRAELKKISSMKKAA